MAVTHPKYLIAMFRRHYNYTGEDILACFYTAAHGWYPSIKVAKHMVSISPKNWTELKAKLSEQHVVKHSDTGVECLLLFGKLYVRKEARVSDENVEWSERLGCYMPTVRHLREQLDNISMAPRSNKRLLKYVDDLRTAITNERLNK